MITAFALLLDRCGLSIREAADYLSVRPDTVKSWSAGRNPAPAGAVAELRSLYQKIDRAARQALAEMAQAPEGIDIEIGIAADDHEAGLLGLPCVGAHAALLGLIVAGSSCAVRIVPRGSTGATAAAAEIHRK